MVTPLVKVPLDRAVEPTVVGDLGQVLITAASVDKTLRAKDTAVPVRGAKHQARIRPSPEDLDRPFLMKILRLLYCLQLM